MFYNSYKTLLAKSSMLENIQWDEVVAANQYVYSPLHFDRLIMTMRSLHTIMIT